nr:MAG TPA: CtsR-like protein [Caudoviricetes sp.]
MNWEEVKKEIDAILKRGNDVEIRRKGGGYIVLEVKKTIKHSTSAQ